MKLRRRLYIIYRIKYGLMTAGYYFVISMFIMFLPIIAIIGIAHEKGRLTIPDWVFDYCGDKEELLRKRRYEKFYRVFSREEMQDKYLCITKTGKQRRRKALKRGY